MYQLCRIGATMLLLLSLLAPTMTCAIPSAQMTAAEHSCCKQMKGNCGTMHMPASHRCCQIQTGSNHLDLVQPKVASCGSHFVAVTVAAVELLQPRFPGLDHLLFQKADHSPPHFRPRPSILRI